MEKLRVEDSLVAAQKLEEWSRMSLPLAMKSRNRSRYPEPAIPHWRLGGRFHADRELARMAGDEAQRVLTLPTPALLHPPDRGAESIDLQAAVKSVEFPFVAHHSRKGIDFEITCTGVLRIEGYAAKSASALEYHPHACEAVTRTAQSCASSLPGLPIGRSLVIDQGIGIATELIRIYSTSA